MSKTFEIKLPPIRLGEFDLGGVLYHANYFHLYEQGREALLEACGKPYPELVEEGLHLAVVESAQRFVAPIRYGEELVIKINVGILSRASITFEYEIALASALEKPVHYGTTRHAFVRVADGRFHIETFPEKLRTEFEKYIPEN